MRKDAAASPANSNASADSAPARLRIRRLEAGSFIVKFHAPCAVRERAFSSAADLLVWLAGVLGEDSNTQGSPAARPPAETPASVAPEPTGALALGTPETSGSAGCPPPTFEVPPSEAEEPETPDGGLSAEVEGEARAGTVPAPAGPPPGNGGHGHEEVIEAGVAEPVGPAAPEPAAVPLPERILGLVESLGGRERFVRIPFRFMAAELRGDVAQINPALAGLVAAGRLQKYVAASGPQALRGNWFALPGADIATLPDFSTPAEPAVVELEPASEPAAPPVAPEPATAEPGAQARAVLAALRDIATKAGPQFEIMAAALAKKAGIFIGQVPKAIEQLKKAGKLTARPAPAGGIIINLTVKK